MPHCSTATSNFNFTNNAASVHAEIHLPKMKLTFDSKCTKIRLYVENLKLN